MASERSATDRIQHSRELGIQVAGLTPAYSPADSAFSLANLAQSADDAEDANEDVSDLHEPWKDLLDERQALVKAIGPLVTQSLAYAKSNTAWKPKYEGVKKAADKVRGVRPPKKKATTDPEPTPTTPSTTPAEEKEREQGERSYAEITEFYRQYIKKLTGLAGYAPPDAKITLAQLEVGRARLAALNGLVPDAQDDYDNALNARRLALFGPEGLKFRFDGVKTAVKGQYGQSSQQYADVKGIEW